MKLTASKRRHLKPAQFAVPELDGYPIHDLRHVELAKGRLRQFGRRLTREQERRAWQRIAQAERNLLGKGTRARSSAAALARLPARTIVELSRRKLIRFF
jgi:hypothetical protein